MTTHKATQRLREVLAANLRARMSMRYRSARSSNEQIMKLRGESGGVGKETIRRLLTPATDDFDTSLGTLEAIAKALRCEVYELLQEDEGQAER